MMHDDGQHVEGLEDADVVLVGVSRTSKTPTSIYLANRGIRTANVPLVPGIPLPHQLENLKKPLVVSLHATPERLIQVRQNRLLSMGRSRTTTTYIDRQAVADEVAFARRLSAKFNWAQLDVTRRSIEETAAADHESCSPTGSGSGLRNDLPRMTIWRGKDPLILASQSRARQMLPRQRRHCLLKPFRPTSMSGAVQQASGLTAPGDIAALLAREKALFVSVAKSWHVWSSAPIRRWRCRQHGCSASRPAGRRPRSNCVTLAGRSHAAALRRLRWRATARYCSPSFQIARMTMRQLERRGDTRPIWMKPGEAVTTSVGAYQLEGLGCICSNASKATISPFWVCRLLPLARIPARSERVCSTV